MKDDPFAGLSGLDQKLFASSPSTAGGKSKKATPKERSKEPREERPSERREVRKEKPSSQGAKAGTSGRPFRRPRERLTERRPYDFFRDQLLWLNKTKVEIEEKYGRRITANAIVQLALDTFIQDYKRRKERSKLITKLVLGEGTAGRLR